MSLAATARDFDFYLMLPVTISAISFLSSLFNILIIIKY